MPPRATVLDMEKYLDKEVRVKFVGGREVTGTLKGYDALLNLVLDQHFAYDVMRRVFDVVFLFSSAASCFVLFFNRYVHSETS